MEFYFSIQDAFVERINEALDDIDTIEDFEVKDVKSDPELVDIIIRGRLKSSIGKSDADKQKQDPTSDYDRAMKGIT